MVKEANDTKQLAKQINKANEEFDKPCQTAVGDAGYSTAEECEKLVQAGIEVIVPSQKQASHKKEEDKVEKNFDKSSFKYDKFLLRGLENVNAEASIFYTCFNLRRMMALLGGVRPTLEKLKLIG